MTECIICGVIALIAVGAFVAINVAKAKVGWSWINEEEN